MMLKCCVGSQVQEAVPPGENVRVSGMLLQARVIVLPFSYELRAQSETTGQRYVALFSEAE